MRRQLPQDLPRASEELQSTRGPDGRGRLSSTPTRGPGGHRVGDKGPVPPL